VARDRLIEDGLVRVDEVLEFFLIVFLGQELAEFAAHAFSGSAPLQTHTRTALVQDFEGIKPRVIYDVHQRAVEQDVHWGSPLAASE
jgi:hypothetical protein